jgi:hypothetical protein
MALATQALLCPQQWGAAVSTCSTSTSASHDRVSSATGLRLSRREPRSFSSLNGVSVTAVGSGRGVKAAVSASSDFQSTFTAKDLERDAAKEALLLAVSCETPLALHLLYLHFVSQLVAHNT